ncbi:MAG: hypothetical protein ACJ76P_04300 [Actinomycetota bacterium]
MERSHVVMDHEARRDVLPHPRRLEFDDEPRSIPGRGSGWQLITIHRELALVRSRSWVCSEVGTTVARRKPCVDDVKTTEVPRGELNAVERDPDARGVVHPQRRIRDLLVERDVMKPTTPPPFPGSIGASQGNMPFQAANAAPTATTVATAIVAPTQARQRE